MRIRVALSRFEDLVAAGLRHHISGDPRLEVVAEQAELEDLPDVIDVLEPAVVLLNCGALPSAAFVHELHAARPDTRIVVLANRPTAAECNQLLALGATACIPKETDAGELLSAIHLAARGMHVVPPTGSLAGTGAPLDIGGPDLLTPREADVLELLQGGGTNAEIAQALTIGIETVRTHARAVYRKLGVSSRRELAG